MPEPQQFDLEDRFVDYAVRIIKLSDALPKSQAAKHICSQILRSGTAPAPHYGEAQGAESRADFIHKLRLALKEIRETKVWLKMIIRAELIHPPTALAALHQETDELISILFKSIQTARDNDDS